MLILLLGIFNLVWLNNSKQKVMVTKISRFLPTVGPFSSAKLVNILRITMGSVGGGGGWVEMNVVMRVLDEMVILLGEHQI